MIAAISLEAPSVPLIEQLIGDNRMPHLATLQRKGENVNLDPPFLDGSVYSTLYTGHHLSEHGIYSLFTWSAPEQRLRLSYELMPDDTLFRRLDRAGKRVLSRMQGPRRGQMLAQPREAGQFLDLYGPKVLVVLYD